MFLKVGQLSFVVDGSIVGLFGPWRFWAWAWNAWKVAKTSSAVTKLS
jgi:hypothetical protein